MARMEAFAPGESAPERRPALQAVPPVALLQSAKRMTRKI